MDKLNPKVAAQLKSERSPVLASQPLSHGGHFVKDPEARQQNMSLVLRLEVATSILRSSRDMILTEMVSSGRLRGLRFKDTGIRIPCLVRIQMWRSAGAIVTMASRGTWRITGYQSQISGQQSGVRGDLGSSFCSIETTTASPFSIHES